MPAVKISFECSQELTKDQLGYLQTRLQSAIQDMVYLKIDMPTVDDIPEYFYTVLEQEHQQ